MKNEWGVDGHSLNHKSNDSHRKYNKKNYRKGITHFKNMSVITRELWNINHGCQMVESVNPV